MNPAVSSVDHPHPACTNTLHLWQPNDRPWSVFSAVRCGLESSLPLRSSLGALLAVLLTVVHPSNSICEDRVELASASELSLNNGEQPSSQLKSLAPDWQLKVNSKKELLVLSSSQWHTLGHFLPQQAGHHLLLQDSSQLVAPLVAITSTELIVDSRIWGIQKIPRKHVTGVVLIPPVPTSSRDAIWDWILTTNPMLDGLDRIRLKNGDEVSGNLELPKNPPQRLPLFLPAIRIRIEPEDTAVDLPIDRIAAVRFAGPSRRADLNASTGVVGMKDGSRFLVKQATVDAKGAALKLICGWELQAESEALLPAVCRLRVPAGTWQPLSASKSVVSRQIPMFELTIRHQLNRSAHGGRLRSCGREYISGIGMFGRGSVLYDIPKGAKAFAGNVAIDERAGQRGSVQFRVYLAGEDGKWHRVAQSQRLQGGELPEQIHVPLEAAKRLSLIVDPADHGEVLDYANWLDARWIYVDKTTTSRSP